MEEMDSRYHVGDTVRIITDRLTPEEMNELNGTIHEVKSVRWCDICGRYEYRVKGNWFIWCDDDFEFDIQHELPEFDASGANVLDLFS